MIFLFFFFFCLCFLRYPCKNIFVIIEKLQTCRHTYTHIETVIETFRCIHRNVTETCRCTYTQKHGSQSWEKGKQKVGIWKFSTCLSGPWEVSGGGGFLVVNHLQSTRGERRLLQLLTRVLGRTFMFGRKEASCYHL